MTVLGRPWVRWCQCGHTREDHVVSNHLMTISGPCGYCVECISYQQDPEPTTVALNLEQPAAVRAAETEGG